MTACTAHSPRETYHVFLDGDGTIAVLVQEDDRPNDFMPDLLDNVLAAMKRVADRRVPAIDEADA